MAPTPDAPAITIRPATLTNEHVLISSLVVATGVTDADGDTLSLMLTDEHSTPAGLFEAMPVVALDGAVGAQSIVLSSRLASTDTSGVWMATVRVSDDLTTPTEAVLTVLIIPADTLTSMPLTFTLATTETTLTEKHGGVLSLTIATGVTGTGNGTPEVMLTGERSTPIGTIELFSQSPTVALSGDADARSIVLSGGHLNANANGAWIATVWLSDGVTTRYVSEVIISVIQCTDDVTTPCIIAPGETVTGVIADDIDR